MIFSNSVHELRKTTLTKTIACPETDYAIDGIPCVASGDPHFTMWNGAIHHFQGLNNEQYYYIAPCEGVSNDLMPFKVLATHSHWTPGSNVQRVRYIVFELYESSTVQYLLFIGPTITNGYINVDDASGTLYEDNINLAGYNAGSTQSIGSRFDISLSGTQYELLIDDACAVVFYFAGSQLTIEPPECYRCFICGLCGDFKREAVSGYQTIETCDGGYTTITKPGWSAALSDPFTFDLNGNTWGKSYCDDTRRRLVDLSGDLGDQDSDTSGGLYTPSLPENFTVIETCDPAIEPLVNAACQEARDNATACCDLIGDDGKFCDQLQLYCEVDGCIVVGTDASAIDENVEELFTNAINSTCSIPDVGLLFSDDNLVANNGSNIVDDTFPEWKETCPPTVEGCVAENSCIQCDESCGEYCQCIGCDIDICGVNDCMTCHNEEDYTLVQVYDDGTGYCEEEEGEADSANIYSVVYTFLFCMLLSLIL